MMHKLTFGHACMLLLLSLLGCKPTAKQLPTVKAVTQTTPIEFAFPEDWHPNSKKHPYDLHWLDSRDQMITGVFAYRKEDISDDSSISDIFKTVIQDLGSKRTNFKVVEAARELDREDKKMTTILYEGKKNGDSYYYAFTLIEFKSDDSKFAIVIQTSFPEWWKVVNK